MFPILMTPPPDHWLDAVLRAVANLFPPGSFFHGSYNLRALLALLLVSVSCGAVGALVVGGRLAFFSDALAHCSFAGISIGFVVFTGVLVPLLARPDEEFWDWVTPLMLAFGMLVAFLIVFIRHRTGLASDTVIGVAFAAAIGLAAMLRKLISYWNADRRIFKLEDFLFGDPLLVSPHDVVYLGILAVVTIVALILLFNHLMLSGFNPSLALSRRVPVALSSYAFIVLLAVIVNLCARTIGVLLINALLVVPAATAANLSRNLRQMFWWTVGLCLFSCVLGQCVSWEVGVRFNLPLGIPGAVILVSVGCFVVSMLVGPMVRRRTRMA